MEVKREIKKYRNLLFLLIAVFIFWLVAELIPYYRFKDWAVRGQYGDSFGAINSLFSGLAFAGIIYTIILQQKELRLQRKELFYTRKELERSSKAQEDSEKALREQSKLMQEQAQLMNIQVKLMEKQSALMEETAKLNAISTIVDFYTQSAVHAKKDNWDWFVKANSKAAEYVKQLEKQIEEINKKTNG